MTSHLPQWVQDISTVTGIAGFFVTLIVMFQVHSAREFSGSEYDRPDPIWDLYSDILAVITTLNQVGKNLNWE